MATDGCLQHANMVQFQCRKTGSNEVRGMYMRKGIIAGLVLLAALAADATGVFTVSDREILLDGSAFDVRGMCYQPTPIGENVVTGSPYGDYYTAAYSNLWARDFENLRQMRANVVRVYGWTIGADHSAFLDAAYNNGDQSLYLLANKWIDPATDWSDTNAVNSIISDWEDIATELKDHPAVMGFLVGNEVNWQNGNGYKADFWAAINQIAGAVKAVAPDKVVSTAVTEAIDQLQTYDSTMDNLDFWAIQIYRGGTFGDFFTSYATNSSKPLVITEFGYDACDATIDAEFSEDAAVPADAMETLWNELRDNRSVVSGGCVFEYADEWWKAENPFIHDTTGYIRESVIDGEGNEEWWGVFRVVDNGTEPDLLEPRAMFYRLAAMWNEPFALTFLQTGASNGNLETRFDYPSTLRDQQFQIEISPDLTNWTAVAGNSDSIYLESFTPTITLTRLETNDEVQVTLVHDASATGPYTLPNLLANGGFEYGNAFGWTPWKTVTNAFAQSGTYSLQLDAPGASYIAVSQSVPASPGEEFNLSGYMYTDSLLPADTTHGLFKIVFWDALDNDLQPASVSIGQLDGSSYPGAISLPMLNSSSPVGSWVFSEAQAVAPTNTVSVSFYVMNIAQSANTMYFDAIEAVEVVNIPELGTSGFFRMINSGR